MIALDEDALICDFAEFYHIYNYYDYPVEYVAILANGLRDNSRIRHKERGLKVDISLLFLPLCNWMKAVTKKGSC